MTKKELVLQAVKRKETNLVPYNITLTAAELERFCGYAGIDAKDFDDWSGNYIDKIDCVIGGGYIKPDYFSDPFGVVWNRTEDKDIGVIDSPPLISPEDRSYVFPKPDAEKIKAKLESKLNDGRDTFKFAKAGFTLFERAWSLVGLENLYMNFILEPEFVEYVLDEIVNYNLAILDVALQYDVGGVYFGDDYGQQTGLLFSPETWRQFIKPQLAKLFDRVRSSGKVVAMHSCGNISAVLGDLIDIGLEVYQTVQPEVYDLQKLKNEFGADLAFWGGISTQELLPRATPEEVKKVTAETIKIMSKNGGYIASPAHAVPCDTPPENIMALIEAFKKQ